MNALKRILPYLRPYWKKIVLSFITLAMMVAADLLIPAQIQNVIDNGITVNNTTVIWTSMLVMIGLAILSMALTFVNTIFTAQVSENFAADIRDLAYRHIQDFSFGNLDELNTGELLVRLTSDINALKNATMMSLRMLFRAPLMMVGSLIMLVITSPQLSLILVVMLPLTVGMIVWFSSKTEAMYKAVQSMLDKVNTIMQENIAGVQVVKAFVRADYENKRFAEASDGYAQRSIDVNRLVALLLPTMIVLMNLGVTAIIWFGGRMAIAGNLTTGELVAFTSYLMTTMIPVVMMGMVLPQLFASEASMDRILQIVDMETAVTDSPTAQTLTNVQGRVEFKNVSLDYDGEEGEAEPVLHNISFVAEPGETVAILGSTGSGKTSLVNLIPRFYDVTEGQVLVDGVDVRDVTQQSLREPIGFAMQESVLFSGTIGDNIRFGNEDAPPELVESVAKIADVHNFASEKEAGYDTMLGQRGKGLSGGQRQRTAIARALATNPKILILDDSTSAVDAATEAQIQHGLSTEMDGLTQIIVAQRISTVLTADKILVLDNGRITAQGTHDELMQTSPIYQEIYDSQLGNGNGNGTKTEVKHA